MDQEVINLLKDYLDSHLTKSRTRKIIFWYDEKQSYEPFIDELNFENTEIIKYHQNSFWIRYRIEVEAPQKNFILYCPFADPKTANPLLDLQTSNQDFVFNPDQITMWIKELDLKDSDRPYVQANQKFFKDKRRRAKFAAFTGFDHKNGENINQIAAACLLGAKTDSKDELFKRLFVETYAPTKTGEEFLKFSNQDFILHELNNYFGANLTSYDDLPVFFKSLLVTYFICNLQDTGTFNGLDGYGMYLLKKKQNAHIFISSLMCDLTCRASFEKLSREVYDSLDFVSLLAKNDILNCVDNDAFIAIDQQLINYLLANLSSGLEKYDEYLEIINNRKNKYWYHQVEKSYFMLEAAINFFKSIHQAIKAIKTTSVDDLANIYVEKLNLIDTFYRKFYLYYDQIPHDDHTQKIAELIENKYLNDYTNELSQKWGDALARLDNYGDQQAPLINQFFRKYIQPFEDKKPRAIVIISDALRYEVAAELRRQLSLQGGTADLDFMFGMIPSYTKLGMAALLPHQNLRFASAASDEVLVDGKNSASLADREQILQHEFADSFAIKYTDLMQQTKSEWKKEFSGKKIVYIYHNVIDNAGEHNEDEIFAACEKTIAQLSDLVEQLDVTFSGINCFITADHGFYYKRSKNTELNKTKSDHATTKKKKRYSFSDYKTEREDLISFRLDYALGDDAGYVNIPRGDIVFSMPGLSSSYIHGGLMPQEIIIPVISYKISRGAAKSDKVHISYSGLSTKITNSIVNLKFAQNEPVDENHRPCRYALRFEDRDQNIISNECIIVADSVAQDINDRRNLTEKFTFKNIPYDRSRPYYLVIRDEETGLEVDRQEFLIDIAITSSFDF